jgi:hypothetical protein
MAELNSDPLPIRFSPGSFRSDGRPQPNETRAANFRAPNGNGKAEEEIRRSAEIRRQGSDAIFKSFLLLFSPLALFSQIL